MHVSRASAFTEPNRRWYGSHYDIPYKYSPRMDYSLHNDELYYTERKDPERQFDPLFDDSLPQDLLFGLDELFMSDRQREEKEQRAKQEPLDLDYYSGDFGTFVPEKQTKFVTYHGDPRVAKNRKAAGYFFSDTPTTWSQTRKIHLDRPITPVPIKIPLNQKHLWWESPKITLNMFAPYSSKLVKGEKTIETRNYQLPNKCKGVRIGIVEIMPKGLPSKKPELIGEVVFVDCKEYVSREQWEKDAPYHGVDVNDPRFGWKKKKKKFGWVVHTWQSYSRSIRQAASEHCNSRVHFTKNFFVWAYV